MVPPVATCHSVFPTITDAPLGIWGWGAQMAKMKATPHKYISTIVQVCIGRQQRNYSAKYQTTCLNLLKLSLDKSRWSPVESFFPVYITGCVHLLVCE